MNPQPFFLVFLLKTDRPSLLPTPSFHHHLPPPNPTHPTPQHIHNQEDFFRDLEKEAESWAVERSKARGASKPLSLWEELAAVGEELVDYLESTLPTEDEDGKGKGGAGAGGGAKATASGGGGGRRGNPIDEYEDLKRRYNMDGTEGGSSGGGKGGGSSGIGGAAAGAASQQQQQQRAAPPPPPKKTADEEVDEMLAALKKKMGRS